ncbi:MAG: GIY-YIG nuclease family protein [bacterium]|nr:GIY-YIG nuclease family protein [bacterium]
MVTVYVIESQYRAYRYVGITKNVRKRLNQHNSGHSRATKPFAPFKLLLTEHYRNYTEARVREQFLKSGMGRKYLDSLQMKK